MVILKEPFLGWWSNKGHLKSSWTHLITPSQDFVKVEGRSLFQSTSLGKWCISYNAPPTSQKREQSNNVSPQTFQMDLVVAPPSYKEFFLKWP
jgi:hypothetical protein